jgi:UrcA family protein
MKKAPAPTWVGGIGLAFLTAASISAPLAKSADSTARPPAMTLRFNDLNLGSARGNAALYCHTVSAAEIVCGQAEIVCVPPQ